MTEASRLAAVSGSGWRRGLSTLVGVEMAGWFRTSRWLVAAVACMVAINVVLLATILSGRSVSPEQKVAEQNITRAVLEAKAQQGNEAAKKQLERMDDSDAANKAPETLLLYSVFSGLFVVVGAVIALQGAIVAEKRLGTAEWVLSGPVSRPAFVLAKLLGHATGVLVTSVALPAALAFLEMTVLEGLRLPPVGFLAGAGAIALNTLFYIALTVLVGTLVNHWAPVMAVPLGCLALQSFLPGFIPAAAGLLPWRLVMPVGEMEPVAVSLMRGVAPVGLAPVAVTAACILLFVLAAVLRFSREEF